MRVWHYVMFKNRKIVLIWIRLGQWFFILRIAYFTLQKKLDYCSSPKPPQKPKKLPLKDHLAYCGSSSRQPCTTAVVLLRQ